MSQWIRNHKSAEVSSRRTSHEYLFSARVFLRSEAVMPYLIQHPAGHARCLLHDVVRRLCVEWNRQEAKGGLQKYEIIRFRLRS